MASNQLKAFRNKCNVTVRDVEHASRRIAEAKGDKYYISNSWLAQLENGTSAPNIWTIFSLCAIYRVSLREFLKLYDVDVDEIGEYTSIANPHLTLLHPDDKAALPRDGDRPGPSSSLIPGENKGHGHIICGRIGSEDYMMHPLIRPGAFVEIDTSQTKLHANSWHNEFERPIYFIELRDSYACGWCEVQGNQLLLIPHPSSPANIRRFIYPREAEIVGRVVSYNTRCVDSPKDVNVPLSGVRSKSGEAPQSRKYP